MPNGDRSILPFDFSWFGVRLVGGCEVFFDRKMMVWFEGLELEEVEEELSGLWEDDSFAKGTGVVWDSMREGRTVKGCEW